MDSNRLVSAFTQQYRAFVARITGGKAAVWFVCVNVCQL